MTTTQTDVEIIVDVDIEKELACESMYMSCSNRAEWILIRPCKHIILLCNHHAEADRALIKMENSAYLWVCPVCDLRYFPVNVKFIKI